MASTLIKKQHMNQLAGYRDEVLRVHPRLHSLFFELTDKCNERCLHCGSRCMDEPDRDLPEDKKIPMQPDEWMHILDEAKEHFDLNETRLCITGGEPLLYPGFKDVMQYAHKLGYRWGMTSNGTLIDKDWARFLAESGMRTISVSIDGLEETHDWFRRTPGGYRRALEGIKALVDEGGFEHVQITTVVHHKNIDELDEIYYNCVKTGVKSWRVINIEPIGRAKDNPELMLGRDELKRMITFIENKRKDPETGLDVTYGCSHFLGPRHERESRKWYFLCNAGVYTASITSYGDCVACLDIPRLPDLVQGNVRERSFTDIWNEEYRIFRTDYRKKGNCAHCRYYRFCAGDSFHTWDFDRNEPGLCMKGILF